MPTPKQNEVREERITGDIIVDCYNEHEAWSGWWCYLDDKLTFPFQAECIRARRGSMLKVGERVSVTGLLDDDEAADSLAEMQVMITPCRFKTSPSRTSRSSPGQAEYRPR